ncbi:ABC transporter ATP-binding protein [Paenibacillus aurantius]|uniref:ABC transporter ATP-binding protein n=1 Tax=Paenibacillus aurantius TaxID=2918900 RepID=A0AA96LG55_9BACL|nr:ABC transporter ATP-binding protein [Paenibacillus aurantius]WNQ12683.1 ABC transporter ATP-binding protein [Paenibacillus aurantius]
MEPVLYFTRQLHHYAGKILYVNLMGMALVSLLDGIGMLLLIPLLNLTGILGQESGLPSYIRGLDFLAELPLSSGLLIILGSYMVLVTGQILIQRNLSMRDSRLNTGFLNHVRLETYRVLLKANWAFFIRKRKSDLITSMTEELGYVSNGTYTFLQFLTSLVFTVIQIGIAFWLSAKLTLFVLICGLALAFFSRTFIRKSRHHGGRMSELARSYMGGMSDHFNGIKDIKSNRLEGTQEAWMRNWCKQMGEEREAQARVKLDSQLFYKLSAAMLLVFFLYGSVMLFHSEGQSLLVVMLIFSRLWPRFTGIQSNLESMAASIPALKSLRELQREAREAEEQNGTGTEKGNAVPIPLQTGLECRNVSFRYSREGGYALKDIQVRIRPHEMTAIVGRSGAGKSTLVDLLMGMLEPESGEVTMDGQKLTGERILSLRQSMSYVPQDPFLFNGTIRENLRMMLPEADEEQMWEALGQSAAADFVRKLPQGLDTVIGDRGIRLSGGERQRLVLARALLRQPLILVLDEATSALDTENETKIQQVLESLKGRLTLIVIAHRLSTIRSADQVIVLDQGRVVQQGGYLQLAEEQAGLFSRMLGKQAKDTPVAAIG